MWHENLLYDVKSQPVSMKQSFKVFSSEYKPAKSLSCPSVSDGESEPAYCPALLPAPCSSAEVLSSPIRLNRIYNLL